MVKYSHVLSGVFLFLICLPLIAMTVDLGSSENMENRQLAQFPHFEWDLGSLLNYPKRANGYFADNFGLRKELLWLNSVWNIEVRKQSPHSNVVFGTESWLYMRRSLDQHNRPTLSEREIAEWVTVMKRRASWVNSQGAHFLFVIVPDKATVYPEHLPENLTLPEKSFAKQIVKGLKEQSNVDVLDLTDGLINSKEQCLLYDLTDTHWNGWGSFVGAVQIIERLQEVFPTLTSPKLSEFESFTIEGATGDLAKMLLLKNRFQEEAIRYRCRGKQNWNWTDHDASVSYNERSDSFVVTTNDQTEDPKLLMFRDSFATMMMPFLSPEFAEVQYIWKNDELDTERITSEDPDVVILQIVERSLQRVPHLSEAILHSDAK